jgi:hypothetical protein
MTLSGTLYQTAHSYSSKLCDVLFAWNRLTGLVASVLELKGGRFDVSDVVEQLQHGAEIVDTLLTGIPCTFLPVLLHRGMRTIEVREFRRRPIYFRQKRIAIDLKRCGNSVSDFRW